MASAQGTAAGATVLCAKRAYMKRIDGRVADELRPVTIERGIIKHAAGSSLVSFGDTKVICTASYESRVPPWLKEAGGGRGWVTAEYAMLPGSTHTRTSRDASKKGRALEISRLIGRALRAVVDLKGIGECQILIDCDVLQADGGTRTAAITGAFVALHDALTWSVKQGNLASVPITGFCAAISAGIVRGIPLLDLNYDEDSSADTDINVVMSSAGAYIEIQASAEKNAFTHEEMERLLELARGGINTLFQKQREVLGLE